MKRIKVFDTTLRDGEQSPGCSMNLSEKLDMARQLDALGVDVIEAGFAIVSPEDSKSVEAIAKTVDVYKRQGCSPWKPWRASAPAVWPPS